MPSPDAWTTTPLTGPFAATVDLPGSKSLTNRALVLAALAGGPCVLENALFADDTRHMLGNLAVLGLRVETDEANRRVRIDATVAREFASVDQTLHCGNSGTTIRFLAALLAAAGDATFTLDGVERMRRRPVGPLVTLLNDLGGDVTSRNGFPPLTIQATGLEGGAIRYPAGETPSSQFLSAVVMAAPYTRKETRIDLDGAQTSWPYVKMTMRLMDLFGVTPEVAIDPATDAPTAIIVPRGRYAGTTYFVEPDASAASYFLALAAIHPGSTVTLRGLGTESLQGDAKFAGLLKRMGCDVTQTDGETTLTGPARLDGIDADLTDMPDCAQTLAVAALFAVGETTLRGIHTLRVKETDRIAALDAELAKVGAEVTITGDGRDVAMTITPPTRLRKASIATYDDHRMAMSFALAATVRGGIEIENPACVNKTFPEFFDVLANATAGA